MRIFLVPAAFLVLAACSPATPAELTASLQTAPPGAGHELGGSVDFVETDTEAGLVTISGWHMLTPKTAVQELRVYAPGALGVESVMRFPRPDVVSAVGNNDLRDAGYRIVLRIEPGTELSELCVSMTDSHYGARIMNRHSPDQPRCPSVG